MRKTSQMKLAELMVLKQDIDQVLEYLGKTANFQIQNETDYSGGQEDNPHSEMLASLQGARGYLSFSDAHEYAEDTTLPTEKDIDSASVILDDVENLRQQEQDAAEQKKRVVNAYEEALSFANLKVAYSEFEHLTFLTMRIGKIDPQYFEELKFSVGDRAVIVPLGEDKTRILAATSKKGRFALDTELKRYGFAALEIPKDFKGIPDDVLESLKKQVEESTAHVASVSKERARFSSIHREEIIRLMLTFSLGSKVQSVRESLESTQLVYRIMGWISADDSTILMQDLDDRTEGRIAIRLYAPNEVPSVQNGREKVPVRFQHGALVKSFERMIFSYGAPLYGTVDPTPIVAFFFTLLFGIMFGDVGQGLVFFLIGVLLTKKLVPILRKSYQFGPIFLAIGTSSMIMGLLTGEFFANSNVLQPFGYWVTGLFGEPRDVILEIMPSKGSLDKLMYFFAFTLVIGFIINSVGLIINIVNQFSLGRPSKAIFSKTGICGAVFFWYVIFFALRIGLTDFGFAWYDAAVLGTSLIGLFFGEPFSRIMDGHRPVLENGLFSALIEGVVELLEVVSSYLSNSVSFLRVGAFALAHAVLSFIIFTMTGFVGGSLSAGGILIAVLGNLVIIVLEGLIVAIQVIRLQYYEFFSKFFTETGREFIPFRFTYKEK
ncbi:MAG TPA: ATPase [Treponema sp.]|nr:ATPase [Treponema sp.]